MTIFALTGTILLVVRLVLLALAVWAVIDAAIRPTEAFPAAGKLTKPGWLLITIIAGAATYFFGAISFLGIIGVIASIVYLVDVRPAVRELQLRRRQSNGGRR